MSVEVLQRDFRVLELKNYGTERKPSYTIKMELEASVRETPDEMHYIFTRTGLISRETIPFEAVNFRGSARGDAPFYAAKILHEGDEREYKVLARELGGLLKAVNYEPVIIPEEMRLLHPASFHRAGIEVLSFEIHNYKPHFALFISSKRYESFDLWVHSEEEGGKTSLRALFAEAGMREKKPPCVWYLRRLSVFGSDLEEEARELLEERV